MKKCFLILTSLFLMLIVACSGEREVLKLRLGANISEKDINPDFALNELFDDITFTQLEENKEFGLSAPTISSINKNGDYCLVDRSNRAVSVYDKAGKLILTFNKVGKGPGEYIYPNAVIYDDKTQETLVLFAKGRSINRYDKNGVLKSIIETPEISNLHSIGDGKFLSRFNPSKILTNRLCIIDSLGQICDQLMPIDTVSFSDSYETSFFCKEKDGYNFTIPTFSKRAFYNYNIKKNKVTEICEFDLGAYAPTEEEVSSNYGTSENNISSLEASKIGDYMFISFYCKKIGFFDIWDLKAEKIIARRLIKDFRNFDNNTYFSCTLPNGKTVNLITPRILTHDGRLVFCAIPSEFAKANVENIDPEGNMVIVTMKLK